GRYEGRPVASRSTPPNLSSARSSPPTKTSITRTGLSSSIQSSRHSGNRVLCPRSIPSTKRFIRFLRKSRRNHTSRITSTSAFLHSQGHEQKCKPRHSALFNKRRLALFARRDLRGMFDMAAEFETH